MFFDEQGVAQHRLFYRVCTMPAWFDAVAANDLAIVSSLLEAGQAVDDTNEDGLTGLFVACAAGALSAVKALLEAGANANFEQAGSWRTPLHAAADAYREDPNGKPELEDLVMVLVEGGSMAFPDKAGKLPNVGDDASGLVLGSIDKAERAGKPLLASRREERRLRGQHAFEEALNEHISNASACSVVVCDTAATDGYQYGSR
mmetsp:Transcript_25352/g.83333  ORF Transcript_25352/g.83333 Transcript_25352/m.83333 type:complete len:203 (+) Transcript_25352:412-1020(+)